MINEGFISYFCILNLAHIDFTIYKLFIIYSLYFAKSIYNIYSTAYTKIWLLDDDWYETCKVNDDPIYDTSSSSYRNYYTRVVLFSVLLSSWWHCEMVIRSFGSWFKSVNRHSFSKITIRFHWWALYSNNIGINAFDFQCPDENQSYSTCKSMYKLVHRSVLNQSRTLCLGWRQLQSGTSTAKALHVFFHRLFWMKHVCLLSVNPL